MAEHLVEKGSNSDLKLQGSLISSSLPLNFPHSFFLGLSTGIIPDAATIFAMKKQRERARQLGTGADFVPLKATSKKYKDITTGSKSRLVREEDEDSEEERIEFKGTHKKSFPALERRKEVCWLFIQDVFKILV